MDAELWCLDLREDELHETEWHVRGRLTRSSLTELRAEVARIIAEGNEPEVRLARADTRCGGGECFAYISRDAHTDERDSQWTPRGKDYATLCAIVRGAVAAS